MKLQLPIRHFSIHSGGFYPVNTKKAPHHASMGEAFHIDRMAHCQREYYLFVNVLRARKALKQGICW
ncbi:MAG: hypothetical protein MR425_03325 [Lachnospiraceae bacterium]|nr:hypothetical protein [Lachnospiraceae bacterium]